MVDEAVGMGVVRNKHYFKVSDQGEWDIVPSSLNDDYVNHAFERWAATWARFLQVRLAEVFLV